MGIFDFLRDKKKQEIPVQEDKGMMMNRIYYERADRLCKSGIRLSRDEFAEMIV